MLRIGRSYILKKEGDSYLCADIAFDQQETTLWFAVDEIFEDSLSVGRSDAFVMALLPKAMKDGQDIMCEDPISERLCYQLNHYLIPTLAFEGSCYYPIRINAPFTQKKYLGKRAVATGFSGGVDSLYTIMRHNVECEYPITHITVFNCGTAVFNSTDAYAEGCQRAKNFGKEQGIEVVCVDTNIHKVIWERYDKVYSFRLIACALALQGLFKIYLLSSGPNAAEFELDLQICDRYDLLTVNCASTESLCFYLSGMETKRGKKLELLTDWEPSWRWLHPCTRAAITSHNCGQCKKCICDQTTLYALDRLGRYEAVFDVDYYLKHLPQRIGFVLAKSGSRSYAETQQLLQERNVLIPQTAYIYAEQFRRAMHSQEGTE